MLWNDIEGPGEVILDAGDFGFSTQVMAQWMYSLYIFC